MTASTNIADLQNIKINLVSKLGGYGYFTTIQLFAAGATWSVIHKLTDAGMIRFERALTADSNNQCILQYLVTF